MDPLAKQTELTRLLPSGTFDVVQWVAECGSTNSVLADEVRLASNRTTAETQPRAVLIADRQTAGRGRLGRVWESPVGTSLTMSVRLPMPGAGHDRAGLVPLAVGVAVREAVLALGVAADRVELKWPNDLMDPVTGRKIAGILCESAGLPLTVVVGVGLNLRRPAEVEGAVAERAQWLGEIGATDIDPVRVAAAVATAIAELVRQLDSDCQPVIEQIRRGCATVGRDVSVQQHSETFSGRAVGIDDAGALIVRRSDTGQQVSVHAADVVHLRPDGPGFEAQPDISAVPIVATTVPSDSLPGIGPTNETV